MSIAYGWLKVLCLDPSSTRTGYAVMEIAGPNVLGEPRLRDAGYLTPKGGTALQRIKAMNYDLVDLLGAEEPDAAVIEITSGKVARRHGGGGAGLAVYGMAVGVLLGTLFSRELMAGEFYLFAPLENEWTRGVPKRRRQAEVAMMFPAYRAAMSQDGGADVADAIGLGLWYAGQCRSVALQA